MILGLNVIPQRSGMKALKACLSMKLDTAMLSTTRPITANMHHEYPLNPAIYLTPYILTLSVFFYPKFVFENNNVVGKIVVT